MSETVDYLAIGKADGDAQFAMDALTDTTRRTSLLVYTATTTCSEKFAGRILSQSEYIGGFIIGYLETCFEFDVDQED